MYKVVYTYLKNIYIYPYVIFCMLICIYIMNLPDSSSLSTILNCLSVSQMALRVSNLMSQSNTTSTNHGHRLEVRYFFIKFMTRSPNKQLLEAIPIF